MNKFYVIGIFSVATLIIGGLGYLVGLSLNHSNDPVVSVGDSDFSSPSNGGSTDPNSMQVQGTNGSTPPALQQPPQGPVHPDCGAGVPLDAIYFSRIDTCIHFPELNLVANSESPNTIWPGLSAGEYWSFEHDDLSLLNGGSIGGSPTEKGYLSSLAMVTRTEAADIYQACNNQPCTYNGLVYGVDEYDAYVLSIQQQIVDPVLQGRSFLALNPNFNIPAGVYDRYIMGDPTFLNNDGIDFINWTSKVHGDFGHYHVFATNINDNILTIVYYLDGSDPANQNMLQDGFNRFDNIDFYVN